MTIDRADQFPDDRRCRWDEWQPELYRRWRMFAHWCPDSPSDAEDLVQETALRAWQRHRDEPFPTLKDAVTWGATVLHNLVRDDVRQQARHAGVPLDDVPDTTADRLPAPDEIVENREERGLVRKALDQLSAGDRRVIRAVHFERMSYAEGAALLGITENAFGVRVHRALHRLREHLAKLGIHHVPTPLLTFQPGRRLRGDRAYVPMLGHAVAIGAAALAFGHGPATPADRAPAPPQAVAAPTWGPRGEPVEPVARVVAVRLGGTQVSIEAHVSSPPTLNAVACASLRNHQAGYCYTSGRAKRARVVYVRVPTGRVIGSDTYVDVEQSVVTRCEPIPDNPFVGCAWAEPHPDPTAGEEASPGGEPSP